MSHPSILDLKGEDVKLLLAAQCHIGSENTNANMKKYIFSRRQDGIHLINLSLLWEKLVLAARIIVTIENPNDICIVSSCLNGRRPALKFAEYVGATCIIDRYIPGTFTNTTVRRYTEPLLLISTDPFADAQIIKESRYCNMPVIAMANTHNSLKNIDVAIPCNNIGRFSIGVITWLLTRTVLRLRGSLTYSSSWDVKVDMFFYLEEKENEVDQVPQKTQEWNEQPSWTKDTWKESSSTFDPQASFGDKMPWPEETPGDSSSNWLSNLSNPIMDLNSFLGQTSGELTSWADDTDFMMEPQVTSDWGSSSIPKKISTVATGGWDSSGPKESSSSKAGSSSGGGWGQSGPQQGSSSSTGGWDSRVFEESATNEEAGWGSKPSNTSSGQKQWGQ